MVGVPVGPNTEHVRGFLIDAVKRLEAQAYCYVNDGAEWMKGALITLPPAPKGMGKVDRIARARNEIRKHFLDSDFTHLYFHDADVIPPADILKRLLALNAPIATGLCPLRNWGQVAIPTMSEAVNGTGETMYGAQHLEGGVLACGMACCLIERSVLERVEFRQGKELGGVSEDFKFCQDAGVSPVMDDGAICWHVDADGTAGRIVVGEPQRGIVYEGQPHFVSNKYGPWQAGVPRFDLTEDQIALHGPDFTARDFRQLKLETRPAAEVVAGIFGERKVVT